MSKILTVPFAFDLPLSQWFKEGHSSSLSSENIIGAEGFPQSVIAQVRRIKDHLGCERIHMRRDRDSTICVSLVLIFSDERDMMNKLKYGPDLESKILGYVKQVMEDSNVG